MARKSYDQRLKKRWLKKQRRDRQQRIQGFEQTMNIFHPVQRAITALFTHK